MARGQRTNLASLANSVGDHSPVEQTAAMPSRTAPLTDLTPNPRNPRDDLGDLSDLESIADMQLQPAVVVTKSAYLTLYPARLDHHALRRHQRLPAPGRRPQIRPHRPGHRRQRRHRPRPRHAHLGLASPRTSTGKTSTSSKKPKPWILW